MVAGWGRTQTEERSSVLQVRRDYLGNILEFNSNLGEAMCPPGERFLISWGIYWSITQTKLGEVKRPPGESFFASTSLISFFQVLDLEEVSARQCKAEYKPLGVELLDRYQTDSQSQNSES